ncbi:hypothetical protein AMECASPLE_017680 [Ameca splendens]|uniref:Uncharacterized protein n=1 Tax=Ameca splendens TaxID=208324 RepID=A0ABV0YPU1_9TELE
MNSCICFHVPTACLLLNTDCFKKEASQLLPRFQVTALLSLSSFLVPLGGGWQWWKQLWRRRGELVHKRRG